MKTTIWTEEQIFLEQYAEEMSVLMLLNTTASEIAKSTYRIVKKRGSVQTLLEQLYETHTTHLENRSLQARLQLQEITRLIMDACITLGKEVGQVVEANQMG